MTDIVLKKLEPRFPPLSAFCSAQQLWEALGKGLVVDGNELDVNFAVLDFTRKELPLGN